jgi:hypothetical protein
MKITINGTTMIVELDGIARRVWEGHTASGIPVHCFIPRVAVADGLDHSEFERELEEQRAPSPEVAAIPARMIL